MSDHLESLSTEGVAFFRAEGTPQGDTTFLRDIELAVANTVTMFPVIEGEPNWQRLDVDLKKETHRFGGIGYNPMHMDFVNTTQPPKYLCLACIRQDPLGGGSTLLAPTDEIIATLDEDTKAQLRTELYSEGKFFNLINVGEEYKGFPILDDGAKDRWLRFSGKMLPPYNSGKGNMDLLRKLDAIVNSKLIKVMLKPGDVAILDQRRFLHGRDALGEGQETLGRDERRLFYQGFFKPNEV